MSICLIKSRSQTIHFKYLLTLRSTSSPWNASWLWSHIPLVYRFVPDRMDKSNFPDTNQPSAVWWTPLWGWKFIHSSLTHSVTHKIKIDRLLTSIHMITLYRLSPNKFPSIMSSVDQRLLCANDFIVGWRCRPIPLIIFIFNRTLAVWIWFDLLCVHGFTKQHITLNSNESNRFICNWLEVNFLICYDTWCGWVCMRRYQIDKITKMCSIR